MRILARATIFGCAACLTFSLAARTGTAGIAFVTDEATFRLISPPLATQTFGSANLTHGAGGAFEPEPLTSSTNDAVFSKGSILPGIAFSSASGQGLYVLGPGDNTFYNPAANNTRTAITTNIFNDALVINFAKPQVSVGLDILGTLGPDLELDVYSTKNTLLGVYLVDAPIAGPGQFIGIVGNFGDTIGSVNLSTPFSTDSDSALVTRVLFSPIPEPGSLVMLGLGLGFTGLTALGVRARRPKVAVVDPVSLAVE